MPTAEREQSIVIETRSRPAARGVAVAGLAIGSEAGLLVIGIGGSIEVFSMTCHAPGWRAGELSVPMAFPAIDRLMLPVERKHSIMVEGSRSPASRRLAMTILAIGSEASPLVIGIGGSIEVVTMTGYALGRSTGKLAVAVAFRAVCYLVFPEERKAFVVVEDRAGPGARRPTVALRTIRGKSSLLVIGICSSLVIVPVAAHAIRRDPGELTIRVAFGALNRLVHSAQREEGMIE
jgi:hypothetical protein